MAMTKKEQKRLADLEDELRIAKAFRFTEAVEPDLPIPGMLSDGLSKGFDFNAYVSSHARVEKACSSSIHHSFGQDDSTTTQGARRLYSTRLLALRAMRAKVEIQCAKLLADIDKQITEATKAQS